MIIDGKVYCDYCYNRYGLKHESLCDNFSFIDLSQYPFFKFSGAVCDWCFIYFRHHFYDDDWPYEYHKLLEKESEELEEKV